MGVSGESTVIFHLQICVEMTCFEVWRLILLHFQRKKDWLVNFFLACIFSATIASEIIIEMSI